MQRTPHLQVWNLRLAALAALIATVGVRADAEDRIVVGYRTRQEDLVLKSNNILAEADTAGRELSPEERRQIGDNSAEVERLEGEITLRLQVAAQDERLRTPAPRRTAANAGDPLDDDVAANPQNRGGGARAGNETHVQTTQISTAATRAARRGNGGFNTMGHFAQAVRVGVLDPGNMDARLRAAAATTYGNEGVGADAGFMVPPEWRTEIMANVDAEDGLLSRTDVQTISTNTITYPIDESPAWAATGGIRAYWDGEGTNLNQSKPALKDLTVKTHRLTALVPVTEELQQDAAALNGYITGKAGEVMAFKLNDAILNGTGAGMPLGVMNAACKVTVTKETSQTAATIHGRNVLKMMARMPARSYGRSAWLINQDCLPQVAGLAMDVTKADGTAAGAGVLYMTPQGLANQSSYGSILGRPIIVTEACQTLGTEGDIILADLTKYLSVVRGAVKTDYSIHLWFDQAINAFRFIFRMNGQPWLAAAIARKNGSNTLSHFVTLQTR